MVKIFFAESYFYVELNSKHILFSSFYPKNAFLVGKNALLCLHWFLKNIQRKIFSNLKCIFLITQAFKWKMLVSRPPQIGGPLWGFYKVFSKKTHMFLPTKNAFLG